MAAEEILLLGHGTIENLDDLPAFLSNIRRGRPSPPELLAEIRRRYEAIGGSPLLAISGELARKLERKLGVPVRLAMRFWHPFPRDVLRESASAECRVIRVVPLAPYSGAVYANEMAHVAEGMRSEGHAPPALQCAPDWGTEPLLVEAFARELERALDRLPQERRASAHVFFTAHSLPLAIVQQGDRYPDEVRRTAEAVVARAALKNRWRVVYQSQGATCDPWLGPDVRASLLDIVGESGAGTPVDVVFCPIGFLSDHIEVLYDLDIEARAIAESAGVAFSRTTSLNASASLVDAIAAVATRLA